MLYKRRNLKNVGLAHLGDIVQSQIQQASKDGRMVSSQASYSALSPQIRASHSWHLVNMSGQVWSVNPRVSLAGKGMTLGKGHHKGPQTIEIPWQEFGEYVWVLIMFLGDSSALWSRAWTLIQLCRVPVIDFFEVLSKWLYLSKSQSPHL